MACWLLLTLHEQKLFLKTASQTRLQVRQYLAFLPNILCFFDGEIFAAIKSQILFAAKSLSWALIIWGSNSQATSLFVAVFWHYLL